MTKIHHIPRLSAPVRGHDSQHVPMRVIRYFARQVAERFRPDKIILFGSYTYGAPNPDSDGRNRSSSHEIVRTQNRS